MKPIDVVEFIKTSPRKLLVSLTNVCTKDTEKEQNADTIEEQPIDIKEDIDEVNVSLSPEDCVGTPPNPVNLPSTSNLSIRASPELPDAEEREKCLLNSTLDMSPIPIDKRTSDLASKETEVPNTSSPKVMSHHPPVAFDSPSSSLTPQERRRKTFGRLPLTETVPIKSNKISSPLPSPSTKFQQHSLRGRAMMDMIKKKIGSPKPPTTPQSKFNEDCHALNATSTPDEQLHKLRQLNNGSPSASILKRRFEDSGNGEAESPVNKRKRVSFHDPPVSATKEFVPDQNEHAPFEARILSDLLKKSVSRELLKRNNSSGDVTMKGEEDDELITRSVEAPSFSMDSLKMDESGISNLECCDDEISLTPSPPHHIADTPNSSPVTTEDVNDLINLLEDKPAPTINEIVNIEDDDDDEVVHLGTSQAASKSKKFEDQAILKLNASLLESKPDDATFNAFMGWFDQIEFTPSQKMKIIHQLSK